jgi:hypothetical protein
LYNEKYIEFCGAFLGPAANRTLGEDVTTLARLLSSHPALAHVQLLAWLFDSAEEAARWDEYELRAFPEGGTFRRDVHARLLGEHSAATELLRCAVALEAEHHAKLPVEDRAAEARVRELLSDFYSVAPLLQVATVICCRALGHRGRALGDTIFVGLPEPAPYAPSEEHATVQAAHEAAVQEVSRARALPFLPTEHAALTLLRIRMRGHPQEAAHGRWLQSLNLAQFGGIVGLDLARLAEAPRTLVESLLGKTT